jgi:hypothetical protein
LRNCCEFLLTLALVLCHGLPAKLKEAENHYQHNAKTSHPCAKPRFVHETPPDGSVCVNITTTAVADRERDSGCLSSCKFLLQQLKCRDQRAISSKAVLVSVAGTI